MANNFDELRWKLFIIFLKLILLSFVFGMSIIFTQNITFTIIILIVLAILLFGGKKIFKRRRPKSKPRGRGGRKRGGKGRGRSKPKRKPHKWHKLRSVPPWVRRKMRRRRSNFVHGKHFMYKRVGKRYYRKRK